MRNRLGIAVAGRTYQAYRDLLATPRWRRLSDAGARPQRLLWASTGTKDPGASDTLYIEALAAPDTITTMPDSTLLAFADHGQLRGVLPADGGDAEDVIADFRRVGVDDETLATRLQREGVAGFERSWHDLLDRIAARGAKPEKARRPPGAGDDRDRRGPVRRGKPWRRTTGRCVTCTCASSSPTTRCGGSG
jgi:transaldolase